MIEEGAEFTGGDDRDVTDSEILVEKVVVNVVVDTLEFKKMSNLKMAMS